MNTWFVTLGNFEVFIEAARNGGLFKTIKEEKNTHIWLFNKLHILISNVGNSGGTTDA
tara:strand:- start:1533 stop:1706 length:174 start_codon:yes stop_codon:yes gene_type:complete